MKLKPLLEGKTVDPSDLDFDGLKDLVIAVAAHQTAGFIEDDQDDMDVDDVLSTLRSNAYEMAKELYSALGRLENSDVEKIFKKLYPKLYNEAAKKH